MHYITFFVEHMEAYNTLRYKDLNIAIVRTNVDNGTLDMVVK